LAEALGRRLGIPVCSECLVKAKELPELKNVFDRKERRRLLDGAYHVAAAAVEGKEVLVFDDLYRSGATMNAVVHALATQGTVAKIYVLALTRTRRRR
jgi:predicted amidophosphoribosyltransferase